MGCFYSFGWVGNGNDENSKYLKKEDASFVEKKRKKTEKEKEENLEEWIYRLALAGALVVITV